MSPTYRILLVAVLAIIAGGGYWKLAYAPKRAQATELADRIAVAESELAQSEALIKTYQGARDEYQTNYATVARLGKAVPTDDDTRSLLVQLDTSAKRSGVSFDTINVNGGGGVSDTGAAPVAPGAINAGAYSAMPFSLSFNGTFASLGSFFARLERFVSLKGDKINVNGRLVRVENITLAPGEGGWPALTAQVGASAYIVPEGTAAQTAPGATTATGTTSTTTTTTAQAAGSGGGNDQ